MIKAFSPQRAVVYGLLAFTVWSLGDGCVKLAGKTALPPSQILVVSSLFCIAAVFTVLAARGQTSRLKPNRWGLELVRGLFFVILSFANVKAFTHFPMTTVYIALFTGPMIVALLSAVVLREYLSWQQGLAILAGFGGVVLALNPAQISFESHDSLSTVALISFPLLSSMNVVFVRFLGRTEHSESMAFFPFVMRTLIIIPFFLTQFQPMTLEQVLFLAGAGIFGAAGLLPMMEALKKAPSAFIWPLQYSQLITGALLGYFLWQETPSVNLVAGAVIIILSGLYIAHYARRIQTVPPELEPAQ